jgi:hypothetical protein
MKRTWIGVSAMALALFGVQAGAAPNAPVPCDCYLFQGTNTTAHIDYWRSSNTYVAPTAQQCMTSECRPHYIGNGDTLLSQYNQTVYNNVSAQWVDSLAVCGGSPCQLKYLRIGAQSPHYGMLDYLWIKGPKPKETITYGWGDCGNVPAPAPAPKE